MKSIWSQSGFCALLPLPLLLLSMSGCSREEPLVAVGLLEWDRVELVAETNEPIISIEVNEGQQLKAGDIILRQDARRIQAQLDEAAASHAQAQARLAELKRGPREELIDEARAKLQGAISDEENARKELDRTQTLLNQKLISPETVDLARTRLKKSTSEKQATRAALEALLHGSTAEELQQADASVAQAESRVRALKITLENTVLRTPREGLLDTLTYESGERPQAGAVVAVMLIDNTPYARVYVPEPLRAQVHQGTTATIYIDGLSKPVAGQVRMISNEAVFTPYYSLTERDRSRLSYLAEVSITDKTDKPLPSGIPVRVEFNKADAP